jgi:hypothetical protein
MLNQDVVLALLQASTTGSGLILAIYALIVPFSRRLFERNIAGFLEALKYAKGGFDQFEHEVRKEAEISKSDAERNVFEYLLVPIAYPTYLRFGVGLTFLGYIATILLCSAWIVNWGLVVVDALIVPIFVFTTLVFLIIGLMSIRDVKNLMTRDLRQIIERLRKDEDSKSARSKK